MCWLLLGVVGSSRSGESAYCGYVSHKDNAHRSSSLSGALGCSLLPSADLVHLGTYGRVRHAIGSNPVILLRSLCPLDWSPSKDTCYCTCFRTQFSCFIGRSTMTTHWEWSNTHLQLAYQWRSYSSFAQVHARLDAWWLNYHSEIEWGLHQSLWFGTLARYLVGLCRWFRHNSLKTIWCWGSREMWR